MSVFRPRAFFVHANNNSISDDESDQLARCAFIRMLDLRHNGPANGLSEEWSGFETWYWVLFLLHTTRQRKKMFYSLFAISRATCRSEWGSYALMLYSVRKLCESSRRCVSVNLVWPIIPAIVYIMKPISSPPPPPKKAVIPWPTDMTKACPSAWVTGTITSGHLSQTSKRTQQIDVNYFQAKSLQPGFLHPSAYW